MQIETRRCHDRAIDIPQSGFRLIWPPCPRVAEPQESAAHADGAESLPRLDALILIRISSGAAFAYSTKHVEISVIIEHAGIDQFVLWIGPAALVIRGNKIVVWKRVLRVFVEAFHVGVGGSGVEVEVVLLHVLAVVALAVGQAKQPFLEDRVLAIPQGNGEALALLVIAETGNTILTPMIGTRSCMIVGEVVPGVAIRAVIFADSSPLALAEVWSPPFPAGCLSSRRFCSVVVACFGVAGSGNGLLLQ